METPLAVSHSAKFTVKENNSKTETDLLSFKKHVDSTTCQRNRKVGYMTPGPEVYVELPTEKDDFEVIKNALK